MDFWIFCEVNLSMLSLFPILEFVSKRHKPGEQMTFLRWRGITRLHRFPPLLLYGCFCLSVCLCLSCFSVLQNLSSFLPCSNTVNLRINRSFFYIRVLREFYGVLVCLYFNIIKLYYLLLGLLKETFFGPHFILSQGRKTHTLAEFLFWAVIICLR